MLEYHLYGVKVLSPFSLYEQPDELGPLAPLALPTLRLQAMPEPDISRIELSNTHLYSTHGRDVWLRSEADTVPGVAGQFWRLEVSGVVSFSWFTEGEEIYYQQHQQGNQSLTAFWFIHVFLPLYLTLEKGLDFLHCAAIEISDTPVLYVAPSTGGKSTLGAYFLQQGHGMLSDDKVATFFHEGEFLVAPAHPHHRPGRELEVLGKPVDKFVTRISPIGAIYMLESGGPDSDIAIEELSGFKKFEYLLPHYLYSFRFLQERRLRWLAQLVEQTPMYTLRRPWNLSRMPEVYSAVCQHQKYG